MHDHFILKRPCQIKYFLTKSAILARYNYLPSIATSAKWLLTR